MRSLPFLLLCLFLSLIIGEKVQTKYGWVNGFQTTTHNVFLNIPYAAPPVGTLRWNLPQPPAPWTDIKNTTSKGPICPQPNPSRNASEDCLNLNIYSPLNITTPLPVYIFIHGGSFWGGNGGDVEGEYISGNHFVFVSINYRLGALGFLGTPSLLEASPVNTTGFYGIQDQRFAMAWVRDNIASFGGDPTKVTIGGQSAGAISVCTHIATARSAGLFHQVIMESGECTINTLDTVYQLSAQVAKNLNCSGDDLNCLYGKTMDEVVAACTGPIWPAVHDYELTTQPIDLLRQGNFNKVPMLVGTCHDEQSFEACPWYGDMTADQYPSVLTKIYPSNIAPLVEKMYPIANYDPPVGAVVAAWSDSRFKCPTLEAYNAISSFTPTLQHYLYSFNHIPSWVKGNCLNVSHSTELGFLFPSFSGFTSEEVALSNYMRQWWASFISSGYTWSTSGVTWEPFYIFFILFLRANSTLNYLAINIPTIAMEQQFEEPYCNFWNSVQPDLY